MKHPKMKWITLVFILGAIMMLGACKKKAAPPPPPPPPDRWPRPRMRFMFILSLSSLLFCGLWVLGHEIPQRRPRECPLGQA